MDCSTQFTDNLLFTAALMEILYSPYLRLLLRSTQQSVCYIFCLTIKFSPSKISHERQVNIRESATFVVDITKLRHEKDVLKDGFGKWNYSDSHPVPFHVTHHEDRHIAIERCAPRATGADVVHLRRLHAAHPSEQKDDYLCFWYVTWLCMCMKYGWRVS